MKPTPLLALCAITLGSCATAAQQQATTIHDTYAEANSTATKCLEENYDKPAYDALRVHLRAVSQPSPTTDQLNDTSYPTPSESALLKSYFDANAICINDRITKINAVAPTIAAVDEKGYRDTDKIRAQLINRNITWGKYNQQLLKIAETHKSAIAIAFKDLERSLAVSHQEEMRQRQAIAAAMQDMSAGMHSMGNAYSNAGNAYGAAASSPAMQEMQSQGQANANYWQQQQQADQQRMQQEAQQQQIQQQQNEINRLNGRPSVEVLRDCAQAGNCAGALAAPYPQDSYGSYGSVPAGR